MFPCLRDLSLYNVAFDRAIPEIVCALNFSELRTLKLWNCPCICQLLDAITKSDLAIRLMSFEVVADAFTSKEDPTVQLEGFLQRFEGLEELFLMLKTAQWGTIARGILRHKSTLKRLVINERCFNNNDWEKCDRQICWPKELKTVLQETSLECLGISDTAATLVCFRRLSCDLASKSFYLLHHLLTIFAFAERRISQIQPSANLQNYTYKKFGKP